MSCPPPSPPPPLEAGKRKMSIDWRAGAGGRELPGQPTTKCEQTLIASSSQRSDKRCALSSLLPPLVILSSHLSGGNRLSLLGVGQVEPGHDKLSDIINWSGGLSCCSFLSLIFRDEINFKVDGEPRAIESHLWSGDTGLIMSDWRELYCCSQHH